MFLGSMKLEWINSVKYIGIVLTPVLKCKLILVT